MKIQSLLEIYCVDITSLNGKQELNAGFIKYFSKYNKFITLSMHFSIFACYWFNHQTIYTIDTSRIYKCSFIDKFGVWSAFYFSIQTS